MQSSQDNPSPKKRLDSLQAVRAIAFLLIFTSHIGVVMLGPYGVSVFFILSGFLMYYNYSDRAVPCSPLKNIGFAFKRIKRLVPLHLVMMLASVPWVFMAAAPNAPIGTYLQQVPQFLCCTFLVQTWVPLISYNFAFNAVSWFLATCLFMYAVFPLYLKIMNKRRDVKASLLRILTIVFVMFCICYGLRFLNWRQPYYNEFIEWVTYTCPLFRVGDFLIGCELACLFRSDKLRINKWVMTAFEAVSLFLIWVVRNIYIEGKGLFSSVFFKYSMLFLPFACLLVYVFAKNQGYISKLLTNKVVLFIAELSGYAFLIHQLVIRYTKKFFPIPEGMSQDAYYGVVACISFTVTILLSLLWKYGYNKVTSRNRAKAEEKQKQA